MKKYIFRNYTVEYLLGNSYEYSGYNISQVDQSEYESFTWMYFYPIKADVKSIVKEIEDYTVQFNIAIGTLKTIKPIYLFLMHTPVTSSSTVSDDLLILDKVQTYNRALITYANDTANAYILNFPAFTGKFNADDLIDYKYFYTSKFYLNPKLKGEFKNWYESQIATINYQRKKCLVLDFDNTLWGGVLGEDGVFGIKIGEDYPGNVFQDFHKKILSLADSGIIIAACSKNNITDVEELWAKNANLLVRKEHFSAIRVNWQTKDQNIKEIAQELNIGLDSLVFIDDNPAERQLIQMQLPELTVPDFPKNIWELNDFFDKIVNKYFKSYELTEADAQKQKQYESNKQRNEMLSSNVTFEEYVKNLGTEITIGHLDESNLSRLAQMTQKTNQFNLTTKRYLESDFLQMKDNHIFFSLAVKDRFGDSGITGLAIIKLEDKKAIFDTLLLSCRVLGRSIEIYFLKFIFNFLVNKGFNTIEAKYIKTTKNMQVADFYLKLGFSEAHKTEEETLYKFELKEQVELDDIIKINYHE